MIFVILLVVQTLGLAHARFLRSAHPICYGVIFDAGSSGTRVYVYNWDCRTTQTIPYINITEAAPDKKVEPGLAAFANDLAGIQGYLTPLLNFARAQIPANEIQYTPIMLGATAGLRLLTIPQQNAIISQVQSILSTQGYLYTPEWVRVITGQEEGAYLWLTIYYLLQKSTTNELLTIDLGGASTQLATPTPGQAQNAMPLNIPPNVTNYELYSVSYLNYGNDKAREAILEMSKVDGSNIINSPCYATGYSLAYQTTYTITGTGNLAQCQQLIKTYLNTSPGTSINGGYQPAISPNQFIYAVSGVQTIASLFGLVNYTLPQLFEQVTTFTDLTYQQAQDKYPGNKYIGNNYFMSIYVYQLLDVAYMIPDTQTVHSPASISGITPTWTLGAMSYNLAQINCNLDSPVCKLNSFVATFITIILMAFF